MPSLHRAAASSLVTVRPAKRDLAGARGQVAGDEAEQAGLASSVRPHDPDRVPGADGERQVLRDDDPAEPRLLRRPDSHCVLADLPDDGGTHREWLGASSEARRGLADIFDKFESLPPDSRRLSPDERRFAAAEALRWALIRASQRVGGAGRRVVLVVDDIQNVDGASRNAFADVICEPPPAPVLLDRARDARVRFLGWPAVANTSRTLQGLPSAAVTRLFTNMGASGRLRSAGARGCRRSTPSRSCGSSASRGASPRPASPTSSPSASSVSPQTPAACSRRPPCSATPRPTWRSSRSCRPRPTSSRRWRSCGARG